MGKQLGNFDDLSVGEVNSLVTKLTAIDALLPTFGTWTPVWSLDSGTWDTGAATEGRYMRIGNLVICHFKILTSSTNSSPSGDVGMGGFPYNILVANANFCSNGIFTKDFNTTWPTGIRSWTATRIKFIIENISSGPSNLSTSHLVAGENKNLIEGGFSYYTDDPV